MASPTAVRQVPLDQLWSRLPEHKRQRLTHVVTQIVQGQFLTNKEELDNE